MTQTSVTLYENANSPFEVVPEFGWRAGALTESSEGHGTVLPRWNEAALARLARLEGLTPDWDGYGGLPVSRVHANRAMRFLARFMDDSLPDPEIVPLADGGVQLEWHLVGHRVDFVTDDEVVGPVVLLEAAGEDVQEHPAAAFDRDQMRALLQ